MGEDVATVREQILSAIVEDETGPRGVLPLANDMRKLWVLAHDVAKSDLVPKEMVNNPANVYLAMLQAYELRLNPALALQNIYVVNKRTTVFGDLFLALIQRSAKYEWHKEYFEGEEGKDDFMAIFTINYAAMKYYYRNDQLNQFDGDKARLDIGREEMKVFKEGQEDKPIIEEVSKFKFSHASEVHIENFVKCVRTRETPTATVELGFQAVLVVQLANVSLREGRRVRWNAEQMKVEV